MGSTTDHLQQIGAQKILSLVEYHEDYLEYGYKKANNLSRTAANDARLFYKHTDAFINNKLKDLAGGELTGDDILKLECTNLNNGYAKIKNLFNGAGERIGALTNPNINIERFGGVKQGLTLPANVNTQWSNPEARVQRTLNTVEIFRDKASNLLGGIELTAILLEQLTGVHTPLFDLQKVMSAELDFKVMDSLLADFRKNSTVAAVLNRVASLNEALNAAKEHIIAVETNLAGFKKTIIEAGQALNAALPDLTLIKTGIKQSFEAKRLAFINDATNSLNTIEAHMQAEALLYFRQFIDKNYTAAADYAGTVADFIAKLHAETVAKSSAITTALASAGTKAIAFSVAFDKATNLLGKLDTGDLLNAAGAVETFGAKTQINLVLTGSAFPASTTSAHKTVLPLTAFWNKNYTLGISRGLGTSEEVIVRWSI